MSKLNMKVVIAVVCLLLLIPATVAQSSATQVQARAVCQNGELKGIVIVAPQPGRYTIMFDEDICDTPEPRTTT
jgi:hypothetical protein